ncbi:Uncharacterized protein pbN1_24120 [Aromatoleum bremense]|nr:Uncharacterized protein pbN1_24120 [Aromatoleum bremense]
MADAPLSRRLSPLKADRLRQWRQWHGNDEVIAKPSRQRSRRRKYLTPLQQESI